MAGEGRCATRRSASLLGDVRKAVSVTVYAIASNADKYRRTTAKVP